MMFIVMNPLATTMPTRLDFHVIMLIFKYNSKTL